LTERLWPNAERALEWIERWGDLDGDGCVEYLRKTPRGLANQGWKDSFDAISHTNGELAKPPIALAEVQGYLYAAYSSISEVAYRLGRSELAARLKEPAKLKEASRATSGSSVKVWSPSPSTLTNNHAASPLRTPHIVSLPEDDCAAAVGERLMSEDMFSGWGVRTLSAAERHYNPMSYHNGSVWPHDSALAAVGIARYGNRGAAQRILKGLFDAATELRIRSLPELFCGFPREQRLGPALYPVACHPQAWSAASIFAILHAILGLDVFEFGA
jgi:glycogen debranching enzyme